MRSVESQMKPIQIKRQLGYRNEERSYASANLQEMEIETTDNDKTSNNKRKRINSELIINQIVNE
jgi:hypothetical protein